jgi:FtsP/CotA-like multicopper oxidase with cupredoxin domain
VASADGGGLSGPGRKLQSKRPLPRQFVTPLPIPPVAKPVRTENGVDHYELVEREGSARILPDARTTVWGFDGRFPGPTFDVPARTPIVVTVRNELPVPTSTHLHGGVTEPDSDGYATDLVVPRGFNTRDLHGGGHGGSMAAPSDFTLHELEKDYRYDLRQSGATLWYHDHRMDFSGPQVWRGLAGMFLVRDPDEEALGLPSGDKEIPLLICDRAFEEDGSFQYPSLDRRLRNIPGVEEAYMDGVLGDVMLVNGAPWPRLEVSNTRYRLRILNACNARPLDLALEPGTPFTQIGSDIGLLGSPQELESVPVSPAERFDVIVDFSKYPVGSEVTMVNRLGEEGTAQVMRFVVAREEQDTSTVPDRLTDYEKLNPDDAVTTRVFDFRIGARGQDTDWTINGKGFNASEYLAEPELDTVELWRFTSDFTHPVHVHLGHFQVLSRDGGDPEPKDAGWKDTVEVRAYDVVEVLVKFTGFKGRYMLHCHNLEHEDMAMMVNFRTV